MKILLAALTALSLAVVAHSADARGSHHSSSYHSTYREPRESDLTSHGHYTNVDGQSVHSPSKTRSGHVPAGASARCGDGSYSFSRHAQGTCSHHGGVSGWL